MSGQSRQRLRGLTSETALVPGMEVRAETKAVGRVTSAVFSQRMNSYISLAMIKRGYTEPGTSLVTSADGAEAGVRIVTLPFIGLSSH